MNKKIILLSSLIIFLCMTCIYAEDNGDLSDVGSINIENYNGQDDIDLDDDNLLIDDDEEWNYSQIMGDNDEDDYSQLFDDNESENEPNFNLKDAYFDININNITYSEIAEITGYLRNDTDYLSNKTIQIQLDNQIINCITDDDGYFSYNLTNYSIGTNTLLFLYEDEEYTAMEFGLFEVYKLDTHTIMSDIEGKVNYYVIACAIINDQNNEYVTEGFVDFIVNNEIVGTAPVVFGHAQINFYEEMPVNTTIIARYSGSNVYNPSSSNASLLIEKLNTAMVLDNVEGTYNQNILLTARIVDEYGNVVSGGKVVFKINGITIKDENGKVIYASVNAGIAQMEYIIPITLSHEKYNLSAVYSGTSMYLSSRTENANLTIMLINATMNLHVSPETTKASQRVLFNITFNDTFQINEGQVIFKINGLTLRNLNGSVERINIINNEVCYNYTLSAGLSAKEYNISAIFVSKYYVRLEARDTLTIIKSDVNIKTVVMNLSEDNLHVESEFYDEFNNSIVGSNGVIIKVKGVRVFSSTFNGHYLNITINGSFGTNQLLQIIFNQNNRYNAYSENFIIQKSIPTINIQTNEKIYRCENTNITVSTQEIITINKTLNIYLNEHLIHNCPLNKVTTFNHYISVFYEGLCDITAEILDDGGNIIINTTKTINIDSHYLYVNSYADENNTGLTMDNPTTLEKALQTVNKNQIILLSTLNDSDSYNMTNYNIESYNPNTHAYYIIAQDGKNITFDGHNNSRLFQIYNRNLTMININFVNGLADHGGIFYNTGNLTLVNNTFYNNYAENSGGLIYNSGNLYLINNTIYDNKVLNNTRVLTGDSGETSNGGLIVTYTGNASLLNNNIYNNEAHYGGIILLNNGTLNLFNNNLYNNYAKYSGGVIYLANSTSTAYNNFFFNNTASYGSIIKTDTSLVHWDNNMIFNNTCNYQGGAFYINQAIVKISNSSLFNNTSLYAGVIYSLDSLLLIENSTLSNNSASAYGGAIASINSRNELINSKFINNTALTGTGGSLYFEKSTNYLKDIEFTNNTARYGGVMVIIGENETQIENATFENNNANFYDGGAIYNSLGYLYITSSNFINNNANKQGGAIISYSTSTLDITNSSFINNTAETIDNIHTIKSINKFTNNQIMSRTDKQSIQVDELTSDINYNYWGTNDPDFEILTNNVTPMIWYSIENDTYVNNYDFNSNDIEIATKQLTITDSQNTVSTLISSKNKIKIYAYDKLALTNTEINIDVTLDNKINGTLKVTYENLTYDTYQIQNTNNITITYNTSNTPKIESIKIQLLETEEYYVNSIQIKIFTQNNISYYNLKDYNLITSIKNQGTSASCWAYASIASLESAVLKKYNISCDYSENQLKNIINKYSSVGMDVDANQGSSLLRAINYMLSWLTPINETNDTFYEHSTISPIEPAQFHIQDVIFIANHNNNLIQEYKDHIIKYGAIYTDYSTTGRCDLNNKETSEHEIITNTINYYSPNPISPNHAITIVGWDDNYSRYNFNNSGNIPEADGAYIIKNSWGTERGDEGYIYVSYYDKSLGICGSIVFSLENDENYTTIYQKELCSVSSINTNKNTAYIANNYKAINNESIQAIGTFFDKESNYTLYIYKNGIEQYSQSGVIENPGYKTITLNQHIMLNTNDNFTAIIKINNENVNIYVQDALKISLQNTTDESFISYDGISWINLNKFELTAALKVYTKESDYTITQSNITYTNINISIPDNKPTEIPEIATNEYNNQNTQIPTYTIEIPLNQSSQQLIINQPDNTIQLNTENMITNTIYHINSNGQLETITEENAGLYLIKKGNILQINLKYNFEEDSNQFTIQYSGIIWQDMPAEKIEYNINNNNILNIILIKDENLSENKIKTIFKYDTHSVERTENITYQNIENQEYEILQTYYITSTLTNTTQYGGWLNKKDEYNLSIYNSLIIGLNVVYFNDLTAQIISNIFNISYTRNSNVVVLCGENQKGIYVHAIDPNMAIDIQADDEEKVMFRLLTSYLLPVWEEKSLNISGLSASSAIMNVLNSFENNSYEIFEDETYIYIVVNDETNTTLKIDKETGLIIDFIQDGENIYHGTTADGQHNIEFLGVEFNVSDLKRIGGSILMTIGISMLLATPIGWTGVIASGIIVVGLYMDIDGCGLNEFDQLDNTTRWTNLLFDVATSLPVENLLGYLYKIGKLSNVFVKIGSITKFIQKYDELLRNTVFELRYAFKTSKLFENLPEFVFSAFESLIKNEKLQSSSLAFIFGLINKPVIKQTYDDFVIGFNLFLNLEKKEILIDDSKVIIGGFDIFADNLKVNRDKNIFLYLYFAYFSFKEGTKKFIDELSYKTGENIFLNLTNLTSNYKYDNLIQLRINHEMHIVNQEYYYVDSVNVYGVKEVCL